jgi:hypothetical protein
MVGGNSNGDERIAFRMAIRGDMAAALYHHTRCVTCKTQPPRNSRRTGRARLQTNQRIT